MQPEIPYKVTDQLPPIYSSNLCHHSCLIYPLFWSKPSDDFIDEAEEALAEQYDRQVEEFYLVALEKAKSAREHHQHPPNPGQALPLHQV